MDTELETKLVGSPLLSTFDINELVDLINKFGPDVTKLVTDAINHGFDKNFIFEVLGLGGSVLLAIVNDLKGSLGAAKASAIVEGTEVTDLLPAADPLAALLQSLLKTYLPMLQQYLTPANLLVIVKTLLSSSNLSPLMGWLTQLLQQYLTPATLSQLITFILQLFQQAKLAPA